MPYIQNIIKNCYKEMFPDIHNKNTRINEKGHLEYLVFMLMLKYMETRKNCYSDLHDCVYAVIHAGEEFKRRYLDVRENEAIKKNGDISL